MIHECIGNNLWGSDSHLNSIFLQHSATNFCVQIVLFFKQSIKFPSLFCLNQPVFFLSTFELSPQAGLKSRVQKRGQNKAKRSLETPQLQQFSSSLPPARQQVSSRSLEAVWQQLSSSLHAAAQHQPDNSLAAGQHLL